MAGSSLIMDRYIQLLKECGFSPMRKNYVRRNGRALTDATSRYIDEAGPQFMSELGNVAGKKLSHFIGNRGDTVPMMYMFLTHRFKDSDIRSINLSVAILDTYGIERTQKVDMDYGAFGKKSGHRGIRQNSLLLYKDGESLSMFIRDRTVVEEEVIKRLVIRKRQE